MNKYLLDFPFYTKDPDTKSALDSEILRLVHDYGTPFYLFHEKIFVKTSNHYVTLSVLFTITIFLLTLIRPTIPPTYVI